MRAPSQASRAAGGHLRRGSAVAGRGQAGACMQAAGGCGCGGCAARVICRLEKDIRELLVGFPCMLNIVWDFWIEFHKTTIGS